MTILAGFRVMVVGSTRRESLEQSYVRAFSALGSEVVLWDPAKALETFGRGGKLGVIFSRFVHVEAWLRKANLQLLQAAEEFQPDLMLIIATTGIRAGTLAQIKVRLPKCPTYCIYPDSPHNLDSERIHCLPFFDRVTVSSPAWIRAFMSLGAAKAIYLPFAADTILHQPWDAEPTYGRSANVGFIGTWRPEREKFLEHFVEFGLRIWGSSYWRTRTRRNSPLRECWAGRQVVGKEFAMVCATTKVMLNMIDNWTWPGPNMRTFEHAACQAFGLTTRTPAVLDLFAEGELIECFDSTGEAIRKVEYYLDAPAPRERVATAMHAFVTSHRHTYLDRAKHLHAWLEVDRKLSK